MRGSEFKSRARNCRASSLRRYPSSLEGIRYSAITLLMDDEDEDEDKECVFVEDDSFPICPLLLLLDDEDNKTLLISKNCCVYEWYLIRTEFHGGCPVKICDKTHPTLQISLFWLLWPSRRVSGDRYETVPTSEDEDAEEADAALWISPKSATLSKNEHEEFVKLEFDDDDDDDDDDDERRIFPALISR